MSNLGGYQFITTMAKKVGGPYKLLGITAACGALIGGGTVTGSYEIKKKIKREFGNKKKAGATAVVHVVQREGCSNEGLLFKVGDKFKILEVDGDVTLIEKLYDKNNPYFVSREFLSSISDYSLE